MPYELNKDEGAIGKGPKRKPPPPFRSLETLLDFHEKLVRHWWADPARTADDHHRPMVIAVCHNGDVVPILVASEFDDDAKDELTADLRIRFKRWGVARYVFVAEAWMLRGSAENPEGLVVRPSESDQRVEVMNITAADAREARSRLLFMERDWSTGKVTGLRRDPDMEDAALHGGRFADLLMPQETIPIGLQLLDQIRDWLLFTGMPAPNEEARALGRELWEAIDQAVSVVINARDEHERQVGAAAFDLAVEAARMFVHKTRGHPVVN